MAIRKGQIGVTVTGSCKENVKIRSMDRLTLITKKRIPVAIHAALAYWLATPTANRKNADNRVLAS
jgi:hypothetical protein